jgi:hypothetical protein
MSNVEKVSVVMEKQLKKNNSAKRKDKKRATWVYKSTAGFILNPTPPFGFLIPRLWVKGALNNHALTRVTLEVVIRKDLSSSADTSTTSILIGHSLRSLSC